MTIFATRSLAVFYRQLSNLLSSGIPIIEALDSMATHAGSGRMQAIALYMKEDLAQGTPLDEVFAKLSHTFPPWHIHVIKYSQQAGHLAEDFDVLATYLEKEYSTRLGIMTKLAYPVLLLLLALVLLPLVDAFAGGGRGYICGLLRLLLPLGGLAFLLCAVRFLIQRTQLKNAYDYALANMPLMGQAIRKLILVRFIRALRCLYAAGVPIVSAWNMAAEASGNGYIRNALRRASMILEQGRPISQAIVQAGVFNPQTITIIASAEKSGTLAQALATINNYYEKENEAAIGIVAGVVPVIVYLLVAGFIALRIISFYVGYFQRASAF